MTILDTLLIHVIGRQAWCPISVFPPGTILPGSWRFQWVTRISCPIHCHVYPVHYPLSTFTDFSETQFQNMSNVKTEAIYILSGNSVTVFSLYVGSNPDWTALRETRCFTQTLKLLSRYFVILGKLTRKFQMTTCKTWPLLYNTTLLMNSWWFGIVQVVLSS